ncbi:MAG: hypothetical protein J5986_05540 [Roseburia sp.]|nr:hypothetical protein [Roseburia sp.]
MYRIILKNVVETAIKTAFIENAEKETAILAFANYNDKSIIIEDIYCILSEGQSELSANISPERQLKLIKYCGINDRIPVVIHSHIYAKRKVFFSSVDLKFEASFRKVQEKLRCPVNTLFIVYGQTQLRARLCMGGRYAAFQIEDNINHKIFKETAVWENILKNIKVWR